MALGEKLSVFVDLTTWPIGIAVDFARFELLTAIFMKAQVFSYVMPCRLVNTDVLEERSASTIRAELEPFDRPAAFSIYCLPVDMASRTHSQAYSGHPGHPTRTLHCAHATHHLAQTYRCCYLPIWRHFRCSYFAVVDTLLRRSNSEYSAYCCCSPVALDRPRSVSWRSGAPAPLATNWTWRTICRRHCPVRWPLSQDSWTVRGWWHSDAGGCWC